MFQKLLNSGILDKTTFKRNILPDINDRAFWESFPNDHCIADAEAEIDYCWPAIKATDMLEYQRSGNRVIMEKIHFDRRYHLVLFVLAELKENKGRFLPQIVNGIYTTCEESYWGLSAHWRCEKAGMMPTPDEPNIDLYAAEAGALLAITTALMPQQLDQYCQGILERVEYEMERRIRKVYLQHRDEWWMGWYGQRLNNWTPWILANLLTVFLLTEKQDLRLLRGIKKMAAEMQFYYDTLPADGGCDEGPNYWGHAGAMLYEFVYQLYLASDGTLPLFEEEKLGKIAAYMQQIHIADDLFVNFADAHAAGLADIMLVLYGFARETRQPSLMNFSAAVYRKSACREKVFSHRRLNLRRLVFSAECAREVEVYPVSYPLHGDLELLPLMEVAAIRKDSRFLCAKGGYNQESHNHNDTGNFVFYDDALPILVDVGINTYTRFTFSEHRYTVIPWTQSLYHNVPIVNRQGQPFGKDFRAEHFSADPDTIRIHFAQAYPEAAGLQKLERNLSFTETGFCCQDSFLCETQQPNITEVFMSVLPVEIEGDSVIIGQSYRLSASGCKVETEYMPFDDPKLEADWNRKGVTRILFHSTGANQITVIAEKI